jgi:hypothetical protein
MLRDSMPLPHAWAKMDSRTTEPVRLHNQPLPSILPDNADMGSSMQQAVHSQRCIRPSL